MCEYKGVQTRVRNESERGGRASSPHHPPTMILRETGLSGSVHVGTRKMVNYA